MNWMECGMGCGRVCVMGWDAVGCEMRCGDVRYDLICGMEETWQSSFHPLPPSRPTDRPPPSKPPVQSPGAEEQSPVNNYRELDIRKQNSLIPDSGNI